MSTDTPHIKNLIDKYFEGTTSLKEEQILRDYFQQENTASELDTYKPIFQYFSEERFAEKTTTEIEPRQDIRPKFFTNKRIYWIFLSVAACLLIFFGLKLFGAYPKEVS